MKVPPPLLPEESRRVVSLLSLRRRGLQRALCGGRERERKRVVHWQGEQERKESTHTRLRYIL